MMLTLADINAIRAVMDRALKAGLIEFKEVGHVGRIALALEVQERILNERRAATPDTPSNLDGATKES